MISIKESVMANISLLFVGFDDERALRIKYQKALEEISCMHPESNNDYMETVNVARKVLNDCD